MIDAIPSRAAQIPEVIQSSSMDCGPACLAALLGGYRVDASYDRLREACQTDVDGTSIDTIEQIAIQLGLQAEQVIIPADYLLQPQEQALPAIAVKRMPTGAHHFIVIWSQRGGRVQVMDPASGRRWMTARRLLDELYVHEMELPGEDWRRWAGIHLPGLLAQRLREIGMAEPRRLIDPALADPGWLGLAALDAAARMVQGLVDSKVVEPGETAAELVAALARDHESIHDDDWIVRESTRADRLRVRGAVLVRCRGYRPTEPASADLRAALREPKARPWRHLAAAARSSGHGAVALFCAALVLSSLLTVVQAAIWRTFFDTSELTTMQVAGALAALIVFLGIDLITASLLATFGLRLGRYAELDLRTQFVASIARRGLQFLRSRPISDMADRSHSLHQLRELPAIGGRLFRAALNTAITAIALIWLAPSTAWLVAALALAALLPPVFAHRVLAEREMRARTHQGAMSRFYLDALLGVVPVRAHFVERALRREHEAQLIEWLRSARSLHDLATAVAAIQAVLVTIFATWLVVGHAGSTDRPASILLLVYWTVNMTTQGAALVDLARELPIHRNLALRLLEPLGGHERPPPPARPVPDDLTIELDRVSVVAGGHTILDQVNVAIAPGEHVAIVGRSGAGKSTLLGLLLGFSRPASGTVKIGGEPLDDALLAGLRACTAWVDPSVRLWNDSLAHNLTYGAHGSADLGAIVGPAQLDSVLARLPAGMQTRLGEGGGLVSGGEGQRVRFGRALIRGRMRLAVLDEPFRGLDRERRRELLDVARARWRGATLLCATHDLAETRAFDRVLVIEDGKLVEDGRPTELATRASRYAGLLAEEAALASRWSRWRMIRVDRGQLVPGEPR